MRTALVLLFLLAAAAAVGSLLPQIPNSPERAASYRLTHPFFGALTREEWMIWGYRHTDHHLRQFAV